MAGPDTKKLKEVPEKTGHQVALERRLTEPLDPMVENRPTRRIVLED